MDYAVLKIRNRKKKLPLTIPILYRDLEVLTGEYRNIARCIPLGVALKRNGVKDVKKAGLLASFLIEVLLVHIRIRSI